MPTFVPRERKHKRLAKKPHINHGDQDPNVTTIIPETQSEKETRRAAIAVDLRSQQPDKVSSKKRKRLDHYVDTKLRREENLDLLKKLAASKVDTSLFQSSKKLGRAHETKRERLSRALQEQQAGLHLNGDHDDALYEPRHNPQRESESEGEDLSEDRSESNAGPAARVYIQAASSFGIGLKRPLGADESGQPIIKRRKRLQRSKPDSSEPMKVSDIRDTDVVESAEDVQDEGFDSYEEWDGFDQDQADIGAEIDGGPISMASDEDAHVDDSSAERSDEDPSTSTGKTARVSAFKAWADLQRNVASDFTPSQPPSDEVTGKANFKPKQASPDPLIAHATQSRVQSTSKPAAAITVSRSETIQITRLELPVVQEEQKIMEAIHSNPVVIICGATGSGKTTQVPQMMFESGYGSHAGTGQDVTNAGAQSKGMIGVTQPRRVAATSVAERVATELGPKYSNRVAHQVRYDSNVSRNTAIKFMTDGVLLREISQDFILSRYSAIIIDEAHERSINTDILIGMLSRIVSLRAELTKEEPDTHYPLKLVIMSATLRITDFTDNKRLFCDGPPPTVQAEGRQYAVTEHFSQRTQRDYVDGMVEKVAKGHRKLPPGGMLVFLTAQNEIQTVAKRLKDRLGGSGYNARSGKHDDDVDDFKRDRIGRIGSDYLEGEEDVQSDDGDVDIKGVDTAEDPDFEVENIRPEFGPRGALKPYILPLYAALPPREQRKVFQAPPPGCRLIVLATNVAETSLTILGIRYVFDCGRAKEKRYNISTGVQTFEIDWISKASAMQRQGRAGRTGPGHCYRLYSSAVYERFFAEHTVPEILRTPLESIVLQLKDMEIENVGNFPFPTAPNEHQLAAAEKLLFNLGAIQGKSGQITAIGKELLHFPVSPRSGKMLLFGCRNGVLAHTIALVAGLAVGDLFIPEAQLGIDIAGLEPGDESSEDDRVRSHAENLVRSEAQQRHREYTRARATLSRWDDQSDAIKVLTAVAAHAQASAQSKSPSATAQFCRDFFLRENAMAEVQLLRRQLHNIVMSHQQRSSAAVDDDATFKALLPPPSESERRMLPQIVAAAFIDQIAIRADLLANDSPSSGRKHRRATEVAYRTLQPSNESKDLDPYITPEQQELQRSVFVHASSVLARLAAREMPEYIVYSHLSRSAVVMVDGGTAPRTRMHPLTTASLKQLVALAEGTPVLETGQPIGKIEELGADGSGGVRRRCLIDVGLNLPGGGGEGWPRTAWKVVQVRRGGEWKVEQVVAR